MSAVKEQLIKTIRRMSDDEAQWVLNVTKQVHSPLRDSKTWQRLSADPGIILPDPDQDRLPKVKPVRSRGIKASELLIQDRK
jgi:hypothetical protein